MLSVAHGNAGLRKRGGRVNERDARQVGSGVPSPAVRRKTIQVDAVYDIETEGWAKFLVGGHYDGTTYSERTWPHESEFARLVVGAHGATWGHNAGRFDHKWTLEHIRRSGVEASIRAAGTCIVELRAGRFSGYDSKAISMLSLADFCKGVSTEKQDNPLRCLTPETCGPTCRGYCRFHRGMAHVDFERVREYLRADCESLWLSLQRLKGWSDEHDIDLAPTIGGASWACAKRTCDLPDATLSLAQHEFCREGYFGGRTEVFRPTADSGYEYDVSAMYSAAGSDLSMPWGESTWRYADEARRAYRVGAPGIFRAVVSVPEMWVPPLPVRTVDRITFPTGTFAGVWTGIELRYAESLGVTIENVEEALTWPEERNLFKDWVKRLWDLRADPSHGGKKSSLGTFLKFYLNSLWGKFGSQPGADVFLVNPAEPPLDSEPVDVGREVYSFDRPTVRKLKDGRWVAGSPCCHIEWASHVTAWARVEWHREAMEGGGDDLVYCDTDSLFTLRPRTRRVGAGLGLWNDEGPWTDFSSIAPKFHRYTRAGQVRVKSKGVHAKDPWEWDALWAMGTHKFEWSASMGFRTAARIADGRGPLFRTAYMARNIKKGYGGRILCQDGTTRPQTAKELGIGQGLSSRGLRTARSGNPLRRVPSRGATARVRKVRSAPTESFLEGAFGSGAPPKVAHVTIDEGD